MNTVLLSILRENHQQAISLADARAMSASDDALNRSRLEPSEESEHRGSNPELHEDEKLCLSPLTRQLSSSVPDLSKKKPDKK